MRIATYSPDMYPEIEPFATPDSGLSHRPFVDYYYTTRPHCRLYVLFGEDDRIAGTVGIELIPFEHAGCRHAIGFASNLRASVGGAGGYLYLRWMKSAPLGMVFGGSPDTHRILRNQKWSYYKGVRRYRANWQYPIVPADATLLRLAKRALRTVTSQFDIAGRFNEIVPASIAVDELDALDANLLAIKSPFLFRLAPDLEYLRWRYNLALAFARYRLFAVLDGGAPAGYVILHDSDSQIVVSHADGSDARVLAYGILKAIVTAMPRDVRRRGVMLTSSHPDMQSIFESAGLRPGRAERPLALGALKGAPPMANDTSNWMVSFDWGDNSLRPPFRNQDASSAIGR